MTTDWKLKIVIDRDVLAGKPIIKGTRISVELILDWTANRWSLDDILESYQHLTREDVLAAHSFAAELFKENTFIAIGKLRMDRSLIAG